jgi:hypothetical protein
MLVSVKGAEKGPYTLLLVMSVSASTIEVSREVPQKNENRTTIQTY